MKNTNQLILYIYSNNFNNLKYNLNISEINAKYILYIYRIIKMNNYQCIFAYIKAERR